ncbi:hypothetical protein B0I35DRAFT_405434 [Stachybotrys elegans]|uniref:MARVEL domain-containing protein n=1 Tax=Stachybotrys elegans TaxID=80388 RepID=A0A8K0WW52_9HYPO|nr:hypothetical protein B0I35DRAFT_405434 [Stachybotrys elegans]
MSVPASHRAWSWAFRSLQLISAIVVVIINSVNLLEGGIDGNGRDLLFTIECVSSVSIFAAFIWLFFPLYFILWPIDIIFSLVWWGIFASLIFGVGTDCSSLYKSTGSCHDTEAAVVFIILSATGWLLSATLGFLGQMRLEQQESQPSQPSQPEKLTIV